MSKTSATGVGKWTPRRPVPGPASGEVRAKQSPQHTEGDFMRDLGKATQRKPKPS